ncbi:MAG: cation:H+ antiporter [Saprospiraceae bacterium]
MFTTILIFAASLFVLIFASNKFIDSAETIGLSLGISPFVIGVTLVAFGTSLPELTTSILAVLGGTSEIVVGNVVGSNITNILLVLGLTALAVGTLKIERDIMKEEVPLLLGSAILLWFAIRDGSFSRIESLIFIAGLLGFLLYTIREKEEGTRKGAKAGWLNYVILIAAGVAIYFGASYTVSSIEEMALLFNINPSIVSISLLALGTSLPEVVVSMSAARKGKHSLAIGNVIGSNMFNTYAVMAIPSFFGDIVIPDSVISFSLPFMLATTIIFIIVTFSKEVSLWKAGMLVSFYIFFLAELFKLSFVS